MTETCAHCGLSPGHPADINAFHAGYTWSWRELFGVRLAVCAACRVVEVAWVAAFNDGFYERMAAEMRREAA